MAKKSTQATAADKGVAQCAVGTVLFREGEQGSRMYVIKSGGVELTKKIHDTEIVIEELGAGDFCGELAMVSDQPRPVSATVVREATVIPIDADQFESMIRGNADIAIRMLKKLAQRLTEAQYRLANFSLRSTKARLLHQLRNEALQRSGNGRLTEASPIPDNIADVLGIEVGELRELLSSLVRHDLITVDKRGNFQIVDPEAYDRYLSFLELSDRFEYERA